jgi:hypothetical protein
MQEGMMFKIEYRRTTSKEWNVEYAGSLIVLADIVRKLRSQGFEVRCLNKIGQNIV